MTDQQLDLDAIQACKDAATPGPWGAYRDLAGVITIQARPRTTIRRGHEHDGDIATLATDRAAAESYANAHFITHAPEHIDALVAEVRRLRVQVAAARMKALATEADEIVAHCPDHGSRDTVWMHCHCAAADDMRRRAQTAVETHVVADDSDDPEHTDDCPGCEPAPAVRSDAV
ncbi:hypothetical protein E2C11_16405 [Streptomyces lavendulae]|nr:hypothetical protein [Streptomyces lavendulae]TXJ78588.1 hypothetical protein E2C11_16405 [Streptomyces lavendulae]